MQSKTVGFVLIILGAVMMAYTGFNFVTKEKVADLGSIEINKDSNHYIQWSPLVGLVLLAGGFVIMIRSKKSI